MADPTAHYVTLDRSDPIGTKWLLLRRADSTEWTSAADKPVAWIPAELDEVGQPLPTEEGRIVLWATLQLNRTVYLTPLPSPTVYSVAACDENCDGCGGDAA